MMPADRAKRYRSQAAEIRAAAALAVTPATRLMLLEIAESYEHLASLVDERLAPPPKPDKSKPCD